MKPPHLANELNTIPDVMDVTTRINVLGELAAIRPNQPGLFGDGSIGATAIHTGSPVITSDKALTYCCPAKSRDRGAKSVTLRQELAVGTTLSAAGATVGRSGGGIVTVVHGDRIFRQVARELADADDLFVMELSQLSMNLAPVTLLEGVESQNSETT